MITARTATAPKTLVMTLESQPGWGAGLVVRDLPLHWEMFFDHGGERKLVKSLATTLVPVTLSASDLSALEAKALAGHSRSDVRTRSVAKARTSPAAKARFASFAEQ